MLIVFEIFGMCINHASTAIQTNKLKNNIVSAVPDAEISDIYSETGNTSGTGNHVDMLSVINFSSAKNREEIQDSMQEYYDFNEWYCRIDETENGYSFYLNKSAPFADNIEGH